MGRMRDTVEAREIAGQINHAYGRSRQQGDAPGVTYERVCETYGDQIEADIRHRLVRCAVGESASDQVVVALATPTTSDLGISALCGGHYWGLSNLANASLRGYERLVRHTNDRNRRAYVGLIAAAQSVQS